MARGRKKKVDTGGLHVDSVKTAMDVLIKGHTTSEAKRSVIEFRKSKQLTVTDSYINKLVSEANRRLTEDYGKNKNEVIAIHVERYNRDINGLFRKVDELKVRVEKLEEMVMKSPGNVELWAELQSCKNQIVTAQYQILSTMLAKEKVLQMHTKSFQIFINNKVNMEVVHEVNNFDLSKLTIEEKIDFLNLLLKSKQNDFEVGTVILRDENKEQTIDVEHEEVKEDEPNINKIERIEAPPEINMGIPGMALQQATDKLAQALQMAALKELKQAGSKSAENDEYILNQKNGLEKK